MNKTLGFAIIVFAASITLLTGQEPGKASIARLDPALDAIVPPGAHLEALKEGFKDGLEGGVGDSKGGYLLFTDKYQGKRFSHPNDLVYKSDGTLYFTDNVDTLLLPPPDRGTNLVFGDADGKTLYLMNHLSLYRVRLNVEGVRP